jgi:hypothetical protein
MIFVIANMGTDNIAPGTPHIQNQKTSDTITRTGFRVKRLASSIGVTVSPSIRWMPRSGAQQVPPVQTGANGTADLNYDPATRMLTWSVTYNGLSGPATMAHFHGPAVEGKNGPPVIWLAEKGATVTSPPFPKFESYQAASASL